MVVLPPGFTRTDTLWPSPALFRSVGRLHGDALPDPARDHAGDGRRGQLAGGRQDPLAGFVMLAADARPAAAVEAEVEVVEQLLHLAFDEAVLLPDQAGVLEPARERADAPRPPFARAPGRNSVGQDV